MQITIFGASGKVGRRVVELALKRDYDVVAFVHSHNPFIGTPHLIVQKGSVTDEAAVKKALQGSEVVISALGSWGTKDKNVLAVAMQSIIPAMEHQNVTRIVTLTGASAFISTDTLSVGQKIAHRILDLAAGKILRDGESHIKQLQASSLDWTVIRSPVMNNFGKPTYQLKNKLPGLQVTIDRQAVAICLLDQIDTGEYLRQAPVIYRV